MWIEIYNQAMDLCIRFFDKTVILLSLILGSFLGAIGYSKSIVLFVAIISIVDIFTKHISLVFANYDYFSLSTYRKAWEDKILTSRELKNGVFCKTAMYSFLLYVSHQLTIIPEIFLGNEASGIIYTAVCIVEISSIIENFIVMGGTGLIPLLQYFKNKLKMIPDIKESEKSK